MLLYYLHYLQYTWLQVDPPLRSSVIDGAPVAGKKLKLKKNQVISRDSHESFLSCVMRDAHVDWAASFARGSFYEARVLLGHYRRIALASRTGILVRVFPAVASQTDAPVSLENRCSTLAVRRPDFTRTLSWHVQQSLPQRLPLAKSN